MPNLFTQSTPNFGCIISEAEGSLSREEVTIVPGEQVEPGTIMGVRDDGKYQQLDPDSSEGNDAAVAILCARVEASAEDRAGVVIERLAEVRDADLIWPDGISTAETATAVAELLARNIKIRAAASTLSVQTT